MLYQTTIEGAVECGGVALHSGHQTQMRLVPAPTGTGIVFVRTDLEGGPKVPALAGNVTRTDLATTVGVEDVSVATVEHFLAAVYALGVDNLWVHVDGPELPILDGSARPYVGLLREAGIRTQPALRSYWLVKRSVEVSHGAARARLEPATGFQLDCGIEFDHPLIGYQRFKGTVDAELFERGLAKARTFGFQKDVDAMRARGLALGGSLDSAIVIDDFSVQNPEGLRFADEFVRHKALDAVGDLALFGGPLVGRYVSYRAGHALNTELVREAIRCGAVERVRTQLRHVRPSGEGRLVARGLATANA